jgi:hypothetical protein
MGDRDLSKFDNVSVTAVASVSAQHSVQDSSSFLSVLQVTEYLIPTQYVFSAKTNKHDLKRSAMQTNAGERVRQGHH